MNRPHILKNWLIVSKLIFLLFVSTVTQALETRAYSLTYDPISGHVKTIDGPRLDVTDITTFDYHPGTGVLEKVTNALGHVTLLSNYDGSGRVGTITDANGLITTLTYTPRGWLKSRTTGGYTTHFTYDGVGQLTTLQFATGKILTYTYNAARYLTDITDRQGNNLHYTLDLNGNRIKEETWNNIGTLKRILEREYNQLNQLKLSIGGEGQINRFEYDFNGNLSAQMDPRQTGNDRIAALTLNPALTDNTVTSVYDALNRLMSRIHLQTAEDVNTPGIQDSSDDIIINYAYNALDQLILVTDATGLETRYDYNALGDLKSLTSPDTGITTYTYDEAGNRKTYTDAKGIITRYSYDALNRLTTISYPDTSLNITYTYDENNNAQNGIGRLTSMQDASGLTSYQYDLYGNLTSMTSQRDMVNKTIAYTYNGNNQLNQITYPSGRTVNYRFDITGRVELVTTIDLQGNYQRLLGKIRYQPFGPVTSQIYGNALMANVGHDLDFRKTSLNTPSILQRSYGIDEANNIVNISDILNPAQDQNMTYDGLSRLDTALGSYGSLSYLYDDSHNRIQRTQDQITDIYNYPIDSHHLQDINSSQIYQYDANGNTTQLPDLSIQTPLIYGDHNRLSQVNGYSYTYNGHGERVIKDNNAGVITYYEYDQEGKLLVETDGNGLTLKEYVYANGQLIAFHQGEGDQDQDGIADQIDNCSLYPNPAQIDSDQDGLGNGCDSDLDNNGVVNFGDVVTLLGFIGSADAKYDLDVNGVVDFGDVVYILGYINQAPGTGPSNGIYYVHNDHLGTPQTITDQNQSVFWQANYNPFGKATITRQTITNNVRFPGQYFDQETGLHYNYHRYYDPFTGRYITSDPIGLAGGLNTYGYVGGNPLSFSDPYGLAAIVIPAVTRTAVAVGVRFGFPNVARTAAKAVGGGVAGCILFGYCSEADETTPAEPNSCPVPGTTPGEKTKGRTKNFDKPGGFDQANDDFDDLNPDNIRGIIDSKGGRGRAGVLPDGRNINVRPNSSDGRPTIEIQSGKNKIKVRYY